MRRIRSVRFRITAISTLLVAATLAVAALAIMNLVRADLLTSAEDALDDALAEQAESLGLVSGGAFDEPGIFFDEPGVSSSFVPVEVDGEIAELGFFTQQIDGLAYAELLLDDELIALVVLDPETGDVLEVEDPFTGEPVEDEELLEEFENLLFEVYDAEGIDGFDELAVGDASGTPLLVGATQLDEVEASIDALQRALLIIVPLLVAGFGLLSWFLVGRALRPVHAISDQVQEITTSSLDRRVPVPDTRDEVSELATLMNQMLTRLEHGGERQRQFSADASHELRSPLSTVRAAAELIGRDGASDRSSRLADEIVAETDRMDELIGDLLELARLDEDRRALDTEPVDLVAVVSDEVERIGRDAACPIELVVEPTPVTIDAAPRQLRRLITNLVDNACRHADQRVVVTAAPGPHGGARLVVDDDGPGIPEYERERIFERFGRLDESRGRREGGAGLGLALVRAIAERHGATVSVGRSDLGGARFAVRFAVAVDDPSVGSG